MVWMLKGDYNEKAEYCSCGLNWRAFVPIYKDIREWGVSGF